MNSSDRTAESSKHKKKKRKRDSDSESRESRKRRRSDDDGAKHISRGSPEKCRHAGGRDDRHPDSPLTSPTVTENTATHHHLNEYAGIASQLNRVRVTSNVELW